MKAKGKVLVGFLSTLAMAIAIMAICCVWIDSAMAGTNCAGSGICTISCVNAALGCRTSDGKVPGTCKTSEQCDACVCWKYDGVSCGCEYELNN
jgi:hypothetical protein